MRLSFTDLQSASYRLYRLLHSLCFSPRPYHCLFHHHSDIVAPLHVCTPVLDYPPRIPRPHGLACTVWPDLTQHSSVGTARVPVHCSVRCCTHLAAELAARWTGQ